MKSALIGSLLFVAFLSAVFTGSLDFKEFSLSSFAISSQDSIPKTSLFDTIYHLSEIPTIKLTTNLNQLVLKKADEQYQTTKFEIFESSGDRIFEASARIRARGNIRKKVSIFPPVKIDFKKDTLDSLGFANLDQLKMVLPCSKIKRHQELLGKELLLYQLYDLIEPDYMRTKLVKVSFEWKSQEKCEVLAFLIEDKEDFQRRKNLKIIERENIRDMAFDREAFLKMLFFQYMIANTDWSVINNHNLMYVKLPQKEKLVAMPYDFDYAGFVGQEYALPHMVLPIKSIHDRYFYPHYKMSKNEFEQMKAFLFNLEASFYTQCEKAVYINEKNQRQCINYLKSFFERLRNDSDLEKEMVQF